MINAHDVEKMPVERKWRKRAVAIPRIRRRRNSAQYLVFVTFFQHTIVEAMQDWELSAA